jgi:peptide/nickel transport system substrate-binding protein
VAATPAAAYQAEAARHEGGVVTVGDWQFPVTLPPVYVPGPASAAMIQVTLFSGLVGIDPSLGYYGDLARSVPTVENGGVKTVGAGMDVSYDLRPGLHWSDGQPVNADDVIFTWQAIPGTEGYDRISGIDKKGDLGFTIHYRSIYPAYALLFSAIVPKHRLAGIDRAKLASDPYWSKPDVVSGPLLVAEAVPADHYTLQRNPRYADGRAEMPLLNHNAHLEKVVFKAFATKSALLAALKAGDVQVALELNERDLEVAAGITGAHLQPVPWLSYEQVSLNQQAGIWKDDAALRSALAAAVDVGSVLAGPLHNRAPASNGPISPELGWAYNGEVGPPHFELEQARAALDADGWAVGSDGIRAKAGRRLQFTLAAVADSPLRAAEQEILVAGWRQAGADVRIQDFSAAELFGAFADNGVLARGRYDAALFAWISPADPDGTFATLHSSRIPSQQSPDGENFSRCANPAIDADLAAGRASLDRARRAEAYRDLQAQYRKAACEVPIYQRLDVGLSSKRLHNYAPNPAGPGNTWNVADWWIDP